MQWLYQYTKPYCNLIDHLTPHYPSSPLLILPRLSSPIPLIPPHQSPSSHHSSSPLPPHAALLTPLISPHTTPPHPTTPPPLHPTSLPPPSVLTPPHYPPSPLTPPHTTPHHPPSPTPLCLTPPHHSLKELELNKTKRFVKSDLSMSINLCRTFLSLKTSFLTIFCERCFRFSGIYLSEGYTDTM